MLNYENFRPYIWAKWMVNIMKIEQLFFIVFTVKILIWKPNSWFFIKLITLVGLNNTHVLNYIRNVIKFYAYQTQENIHKLIFKVFTKYQKIR